MSKRLAIPLSLVVIPLAAIGCTGAAAPDAGSMDVVDEMTLSDAGPSCELVVGTMTCDEHNLAPGQMCVYGSCFVGATCPGLPDTVPCCNVENPVVC